LISARALTGQTDDAMKQNSIENLDHELIRKLSTLPLFHCMSRIKATCRTVTIAAHAQRNDELTSEGWFAIEKS